MSGRDAVPDFIAFMEANGVVPVEPIAQRLETGALIRFRCEGDGKGRKNGWAILYQNDRPAGAFGNYRLNTGTLKWKSDDERPPLSPAERAALQREWREARERREAEREASEHQATLDAARIWRSSGPADPGHAYAKRKRLNVAPLRQNRGHLLIPMFDADGMLRNLQRISPDGEKRFLRGARVDDLFTIIGRITPETSEVVIAEGYASADAINQASGLPTIASLSARNMIRVARIWHARRPDLQFTIFGDDDRGTEAKTGKNPGREAAMAAAMEIGAKVTFPLGRVA